MSSKSSCVIYRNDLKNKSLNKIDSNSIIWFDKNVEDIYKNKNIDVDSISYRISECEHQKYYMIDLNNLDEKKINEFFSSFFFKENCTKIIHMFIESCDITNLPDLKIMSKLETLNVSNNKLDKLSNLPYSLTELCANNNKLTVINSKLRNIIRLDLSNNLLSSITPKNEIKKCEYMDISNNKFEKFNIKCPLLYDLNINNNPLIEINSDYISNIKILNISHTLVKTIDNFEKLECLIGTYSLLKEVNNLKNIKILEIAKTQVKKIPYIETLKKLVIDNNSDLEIHENYKNNIINFRKNKNNVLLINLKKHTL
jgi:hypothetical protein